MTIEDKLKRLILSKHRSLLEFTQTIEMPYATLTSILKRGINNSSVNNIIKICQALEISTEELAEGRIVPIEKKVEVNSDIDEISEIITYARKNRELFAHLTIEDLPLSPAEIDFLLDGMLLTVELIKKQRER